MRIHTRSLNSPSTVRAESPAPYSTAARGSTPTLLDTSRTPSSPHHARAFASAREVVVLIRHRRGGISRRVENGSGARKTQMRGMSAGRRLPNLVRWVRRKLPAPLSVARLQMGRKERMGTGKRVRFISSSSFPHRLAARSHTESQTRTRPRNRARGRRVRLHLACAGVERCAFLRLAQTQARTSRAQRVQSAGCAHGLRAPLATATRADGSRVRRVHRVRHRIYARSPVESHRRKPSPLCPQLLITSFLSSQCTHSPRPRAPGPAHAVPASALAALTPMSRRYRTPTATTTSNITASSSPASAPSSSFVPPAYSSVQHHADNLRAARQPACVLHACPVRLLYATPYAAPSVHVPPSAPAAECEGCHGPRALLFAQRARLVLAGSVSGGQGMMMMRAGVGIGMPLRTAYDDAPLRTIGDDAPLCTIHAFCTVGGLMFSAEGTRVVTIRRDGWHADAWSHWDATQRGWADGLGGGRGGRGIGYWTAGLDRFCESILAVPPLEEELDSDDSGFDSRFSAKSVQEPISESMSESTSESASQTALTSPILAALLTRLPNKVLEQFCDASFTAKFRAKNAQLFSDTAWVDLDDLQGWRRQQGDLDHLLDPTISERNFPPVPSSSGKKHPKCKPNPRSIRHTDGQIYTSFKFLARFPEEYLPLYDFDWVSLSCGALIGSGPDPTSMFLASAHAEAELRLPIQDWPWGKRSKFPELLDSRTERFQGVPSTPLILPNPSPTPTPILMSTGAYVPGKESMFAGDSAQSPGGLRADAVIGRMRRRDCTAARGGGGGGGVGGEAAREGANTPSLRAKELSAWAEVAEEAACRAAAY
ncbi:hypothetical protein C8J57DRAFT_1562997 [Mycena rebaudengoi]|nr:hypothetical protein C8J57DRAFT_1562997 [Mycena rebaudengoi]